MKKQLLFAVAAAIGFSSQAQQSKMESLKRQIKTGNNAKMMVKKVAFTGNEVVSQTANTSTPYSKPASKTNALNEGLTIGSSGYQLQTNSAVGNRFIRNGSTNEMAYVYTYSNSGTPYADRGTGYVSFLQNTWSTIPDARIETQRVGWPNITWAENGKESVIAHNTIVEQLQLTQRDPKGTGPWREDTVMLHSVITAGNWWPRMVSGGDDGNTLHSISITQPVSSTDPAAVKYKGISGALLYSRSLDGGVTWDKVHYQIPGMDSTKYQNFGGDSYAIDARGNTVAIVTGDLFDDVVLYKSIDNGENWTSQVILDMGLPEPYNFGPAISDGNDADTLADTLIGTTGSVAIIIDNNNKVHLAFDMVTILDDTVTAEGYYSSFPYGSPGVAYWTENHPDSIKVVGQILDIYANDTLDIIPDAAASGGDGNARPDEFGTYNSGIVSMPSFSVTPDENFVFLSYSAVVELDSSKSNYYTNGATKGKLFRHTYIRKTEDQGATWLPAYDIYPEAYTESVYNVLARNSDNNEIRMVYMRDIVPGHGVSTTSVDPDNASADFVYLHLSIDGNIGINDKNSNTVKFAVYPNPTGNSNLINVVTENLSANAKVELFDIVGKKVTEATMVSTAKHSQAQLNVIGLNNGIYFVTVTDGNSKSTQKLILN